MIALLTFALFATAFAVSVWTMFDTIKAQMPRMRELLVPASTLPELPLRASRVTVRWSTPVRPAARQPLRAAA